MTSSPARGRGDSRLTRGRSAIEVRASLPRQPVGSARFHGVPRRAIFIAAFTSALQANLQATQRKRAWLPRLSDATCPHALHRCDVYAGGTFSTRPGALSSSRRTKSPQPEPGSTGSGRLFCATFAPGWSAVPSRRNGSFRLDLQSSTRITSNRRAQVRADLLRPVPATVRLLGLHAPDLRPGLGTAGRSRAVRCARLALEATPAGPASCGVRLGAVKEAPVDRAALTATPRSTPTTSPVPGAGTVPGI